MFTLQYWLWSGGWILRSRYVIFMPSFSLINSKYFKEKLKSAFLWISFVNPENFWWFDYCYDNFLNRLPRFLQPGILHLHSVDDTEKTFSYFIEYQFWKVNCGLKKSAELELGVAFPRIRKWFRWGELDCTSRPTQNFISLKFNLR